MEDVRNGVRFQFKRKRSTVAATAAAGAASAHKSHLLKTPAAQLAQQAATAAAAAESPYADELEMPRLLGERLLQGIQGLPERAPPADRLLAYCSSICAASAEAAARRPDASPARTAALADAFAAFQQALAAALQDGSVALAAAPRGPPTPLDDGEVEQAGYQVDLQARKAGLRARLAKFQKVGGRW